MRANFTIHLAFLGTLIFSLSTNASTILDTLNGLTPSTQVFVGATAALGLSGPSNAFVNDQGPQFTLGTATTITEIGAFLTEGPLSNGVQTPPQFPLQVKIVSTANFSNSLGTFTLPIYTPNLNYTYISVDPNITLQPGTYAALFLAQGTDVGDILSQAFPDPNSGNGSRNYTAGTALVWMDQNGVRSSTSKPGAFRILGTATPEPSSLFLCSVTAIFGMMIYVLGQLRKQR